MGNSSSKRRALIVIDVQNEYITGNFKIEYPRVQQSLAHIVKAIEAARAHGIPVVIVQHVLPSDAPIFAAGSVGVELHPAVATQARDLLVEKTLPSCFAGTGLGAWLRDHRIDTLTVVGYMTHNCNDSTIRHAMHEGYAVELLSDASGSLPYANQAGSATAEEIHRVVCVVMQSAFAAVLSTEAWIDGLQTGREPARDNIYSSNQRFLAAR